MSDLDIGSRKKKSPSVVSLNDKSQQITTWYNDNDVAASFDLMMDEKESNKNTMINGTRWLRVTINPGETIQLSSKYDHAIRQEDKHGRVVGGLCPWLKKKGEDGVEMVDCLNYKEVERQNSIKELAQKIKDEASLREALETVSQQTQEKAEVVKKAGKPNNK